MHPACGERLRNAGGPSLEELQSLLGARTVAPLYGHVDPLAARARQGVFPLAVQDQLAAGR